MKKKMYNILHRLYYISGKIICALLLMIYTIRDKVNPPKGDSILFVAHPDDDALFFNKYIQKNKPYVVLLFTGWSLIRLKDFFKVMKFYGVRFRVYSTLSSHAYDNEKIRNITEKYIISCLKTGNYKTVVTHNSTGEYGHDTHKLVHECVMKVCENKPYEIYCPVSVEEIGNYPLTEDEIKIKRMIFETMYVTESWVITEEEAKTPIWFFNEKLEKIN